MVDDVAQHGLVQVMRDLLADPEPDSAAGSAPAGGVPPPAHRPGVRQALPGRARRRSRAATRDRLERQRDAGVLRDDVPVDVLAQFLELALRRPGLHLAMGRPADDLGPVLDVVESSVRRQSVSHTI